MAPAASQMAADFVRQRQPGLTGRIVDYLYPTVSRSFFKVRPESLYDGLLGRESPGQKYGLVAPAVIDCQLLIAQKASDKAFTELPDISFYAGDFHKIEADRFHQY